MRTAVLFALSLLLVSCSTQPVSNAAAKAVPVTKWATPQPGYATLVVKRDSGMMGAACKAGVYIDGDNVGSVGPSDKVTLYLPPGEHIVGARNGSLCGGAVSEATVPLSAGAQKNYRIAIRDGRDTNSVNRFLIQRPKSAVQRFPSQQRENIPGSRA